MVKKKSSPIKPFISNIPVIEEDEEIISLPSKNNIRFEKGLVVHTIKTERWLIDYTAIPDYFKKLWDKFWNFGIKSEMIEETNECYERVLSKYGH